ncbi:hypothetical protein HOG98_07285 [bacterium]|jgi:CDP-diacylglycerol--glycerol-3-phosphate 3-phosphatidyltransferase/CDP-diacylglycerol--serine O-phosphatidyltransferase|nr:hypothetical protein [bacterium]
MKSTASYNQLANVITITRILGVGLIFWLTPYTTNFMQLCAISIYSVICFTDFLDGWVARKLKIVSDIGKILDPLADKILVLVFLPLLEMQIITSFPVFIILSREFAIMALRVVSAKNGTIIPATIAGKIKTAFTLPVCGILLARVPVEVVTLPSFLKPLEYLRVWIMAWPGWTISVLVWATVLVTIWSFLDYFGSFIWQQYVQKFSGDQVKARKALLSFIPNGFSLANLFCGLASIGFAWFHKFDTVALLVLLAMIFDAVDGPLARRFGTDSQMGAALDSKADFISFGVAPGLAITMILDLPSPFFFVSLLAGFLFYASVHFRLKRFNSSGHTAYFEGLPSPVGAGVVMIGYASSLFSNAWAFLGLSLIVSILMISKIPYPHNDAVKNHTFLKYLRISTGTFLFLTIFNLLGVPFSASFYIPEILFGLTTLYVIFPVPSLIFGKK